MLEKHVEVKIKAPYYSLNELTEKTEKIWFVCHGYGQLSRFFLKKFEILDPVKNFLIFPQGLHKFYLLGHKKVGASWMTKEDRLTDIDNQFEYLDTVWDAATNRFAFNGQKIYYFGFSQGVATISRYFAHKRPTIDKLILWAGSFPPELTKEQFDFVNGKTQTDFYFGNNDEFYTEQDYLKQSESLKQILSDKVNPRVFDGKHEIVKELLLEL